MAAPLAFARSVKETVTQPISGIAGKVGRALAPGLYPDFGGYPGVYGAAEVPPIPKRRQLPGRFNCAAICLSFFVPWILFCIMYWVMSFSMHYKEKDSCYFIVALGLIFVLTAARLAYESATKERDDGKRDASWFIFLAAASFLAWIAGVTLGDFNYFYNLEPYYDLENLNRYENVDPGKMPGQQVMDAGRISFKKETRLDLNKTMAFRNVDIYCVAPIVSKENLKAGNTTSYDFWAVGLNCCSGRPGARDFSCGEWNNKHAVSGLRVMHQNSRTFYQLAVNQAEAAFDIRAKHPLLFYWMEDPKAEMSAYYDEGNKYYYFGVFCFFCFMLFLLLTAMVVFSKLN